MNARAEVGRREKSPLIVPPDLSYVLAGRKKKRKIIHDVFVAENEDAAL